MLGQEDAWGASCHSPLRDGWEETGLLDPAIDLIDSGAEVLALHHRDVEAEDVTV